MNEIYQKQCRKKLDQLLAFFNNNKLQMATKLNVSRTLVFAACRQGYVGRRIALAVDLDPSIPMTKEDLRPDIKAWEAYDIYRKMMAKANEELING